MQVMQRLRHRGFKWRVMAQLVFGRQRAALAKRGRLIFIGYSEDNFTVHPIQLVITEASVGGSVGNTLHELVRAIDLVARGKIVTVVDRTLPLDEFQKGLDALARGELVGRAVLRP